MARACLGEFEQWATLFRIADCLIDSTVAERAFPTGKLTVLGHLQEHLRQGAFAFPENEVPTHFRQSAVLLLLWPENGDYRLALTKRPETLADHAGEICLPGGKLLPGENHEQAALRETQEEIGVSPDSVKTLGRLSDSWSGLGYQVIAVVGLLDGKPEFQLSEEVGELITLGLNDDMQVGQTYKTFHTVGFDDWEIRYLDHLIVGLTADLVLELMDAVSQRDHRRGEIRLDLLKEANEKGLIKNRRKTKRD